MKIQLHKKWLPFAKGINYHLNIRKSLMGTNFAEFPRRSVEGYVKKNNEGCWGGSTLTLKDCNTFDEMAQLVEPLLKNEKAR